MQTHCATSTDQSLDPGTQTRHMRLCGICEPFGRNEDNVNPASEYSQSPHRLGSSQWNTCRKNGFHGRQPRSHNIPPIHPDQKVTCRPASYHLRCRAFPTSKQSISQVQRHSSLDIGRGRSTRFPISCYAGERMCLLTLGDCLGCHLDWKGFGTEVKAY
jgi:hypothetical protein